MSQISSLRAALMTTDYPPDIGGLQTYAWRIARDLPGSLITEIIVGSDHRAGDLPRPPSGIAFHVHRGRGRARAFLWSLAHVTWLRVAGRIDLQLHMQWSTAFPSWLLGKIGVRSRYVILVHGVELLDPGRPLLNRFKSAILAGAGAVVAGSQHTAALYRELDLPSRRLTVIPYGNPLEGEALPPRPARGDAAACRLLCMHRLVARKGTALLLEALAGLPEPWALDIVGRGEEEEALKAQARGLGLASKVAFHPPVDTAMKMRMMAAADLFILPSLPPQLGGGRRAGGGASGNNHMEGLGLTLLEAQSLGTPVLAARTGGIPEALDDGKTGLLFAAGDGTDLRDKLREALRSPARLRELGAAGPAWVAERFSWRASLEGLARLMTEVALAPDQGSS
jgi:phosphatidylinositol alpha-1,6-mannosyltransferase